MKPVEKIVEIYRYRPLLLNLISSELRLRYRRSVLGFLWTMLNPLLMMLVLTLVFSTIMRFDVRDYSILLLAGLLPWSFFSQSVNNSLMSIVGKGSLLQKVYIPKSIIPLSSVLAGLVNFLLSFVPLLLIIAVIGHPLRLAVAFLPVSVLLITLFACGFAFLFSCLNVFFRDFTHMTDVLLQALFYASPVIYTIEMVPERFRPIFAWNPVHYLITCFRDPIFYGHLPSLHAIACATVTALVSFVGGFLIFLRFERLFVMRV